MNPILNQALIHFFVYGTLKRGECREKCWPRRPLNIEAAWTLGTLFDTGPYPALRPGNDPVLGEVWSFAPEDFEVVASELDSVEEYQEGREDNLYLRERVQCQTLTGKIVQSYTYIFAQTNLLPTFIRIAPQLRVGEKQFAMWGQQRELY